MNATEFLQTQFSYKVKCKHCKKSEEARSQDLEYFALDDPSICPLCDKAISELKVAK